MIVSNLGDYGGGVYGGTLSNCTLIGNFSDRGSGAMDGTLYNCTLSNNWGSITYGKGGGVYGGTLYNCALIGNSGGNDGGGGARDATLFNCTIANNSASYGGGARGGALINCIVYFNNASSGSNWLDIVAFTNTCTAPTATNGVGNITGNPMFVDTNAGNYHLNANSPCVNTGTNQSWMTYDLDGRRRIRYGIVDMGAYERIYEGTIYTF